ncbi:MAG: GTP-binding protein [Bacteroides sp.]|nr:GTP-binding protein [Bacteroides sp.]MCM1448527.1 GTP-binding protein [Bacteroides sp.]
MKQTKVLLITGYLGSGKTTLLNNILNNRKGIRFAVIVNDIGEVNIDADLIQKGGIVDQQDDSLVALQNGCICCSLKMDLVMQLRDLMESERFDYIVIEASGICEPAPIAQTICAYRQSLEMNTAQPIHIEHVPTLDCICSVVDALRLKDEFGCGLDLTGNTLAEEDIANLVIQQIEFCNIILLNKADEVTPEELGRIRTILHTIQPHATIIPCNYGDVDLDTLLNTDLFDFESVATSAKWIEEIEKPNEEQEEHEHHHHHEEEEGHHHEHHHHHDEEDESEHHHHHEDDETCPHCGEHHHHHEDGHCCCGHHHDAEHPHGDEYGIGTWVFYSRRPMNLGNFDHFVARQWPKSVVRAKGMCYFKGEENMCYLFEQAGRQVSLHQAGQWYATMPEDELRPILARDARLKADWDETYGDRMQKIVFIGIHMDTKELREKLEACLAN